MARDLEMAFPFLVKILGLGREVLGEAKGDKEGSDEGDGEEVKELGVVKEDTVYVVLEVRWASSMSAWASHAASRGS